MKTKTKKINTLLAMPLAMFFIVAGLTSSVRADAVTDWNAIAVQATLTGARPGPSGVIDVAMVHAAVYDAVQAIEKRYQPYYADIPGASGSPIAATARAAHDVLVSRFPAQAAALGVTYQNYLLARGISPADPGIQVGATAAAGIIALRASDGSFPSPAPPPFIGGLGIGVWRPTPPANSPMNPGPWLGVVTPYTLISPGQFRSGPPPAVNSAIYTQAYNEVKALGSLNNSSRTPEQTDQAHFWAGNFGSMLNRLVRDMADAHVDNIADSSRLFALADMAMADAIITAWNDKSHYVFWRPITGIQNGDIDGNSETVGDPKWTSLIANPPYPDHTSGANAITSATMRTLENFFGTDHMDFFVGTTNNVPTNQDTRSFRSFSAVVQEVVDARVFLGIHFRFADDGARKAGTHVADWGYENYMQPVNRSR